ncbi:MAG: YceI family protein [Bacteroidales bacterium]
MKQIAFFLLLTLGVASLQAQEKYTADASKSKLEWLGEKVTGEHHGTINLQSGFLLWKSNAISSGEFVIDMTSITCLDLTDPQWSGKLVGHLKSDDFFGVEKFPTSKLVITGSTPFEKGTAVVKGNLTIKGITNPVEFRASYQSTADGLRFYANITVDRSKYDIRYGSGSFFDNLGDKTIYDEFKLKVNLLVTK